MGLFDRFKKTNGNNNTTTTQSVNVGGRSVNVNVPTTKPSTNTTKQNVTVGGREIKVDVPTPKYAQNKPAVKSNSQQNVTVGGRDITNQVVQQKKNEALNVPKSNPVVNKVKDAVNNVFQMAGVETGRMKLKNDYTEQRKQAKLESVNAQNMELANTTTPEMYSKMFTPSGQRVDNSKEIEGIKNEMAQLNARIAEIGNDDMAIAEISRRSELQEQLDAFDDLNKRAQAIEELSTQNWYRENGDEQGLAQYQEMLSHKNDNFFERSANALNHLGNTTANIIPTAFDQMEELGSNKMAMDSIATLEEMHNAGEIDDAKYLESLAEWQDFIDVHKSTNSDNLSQVIRANADRLSANTYYGASDIEKFCLQAGESTAQFLLHFAIGQALAGATLSTDAILSAGMKSAAKQLGADAVLNMSKQELLRYGANALGGGIATVSMSLASGTDKMNQLLMQGVDPQTAAQNGLMTGLVSYATEKIGMDRFVDMMGTPFSADALGSIVLNQLKSGLSEGLEEVAEGLVDPLIDYATLGIPYEVNGDELKMEFLLGGASGLAMAVGGTVIGTAQEAMGVNAYLNERRAAREAVMNQNGGLIINTQYQKNQVIDEINMLQKHYDTMTEHQKEVAREVIAKGENAIRNFEQTSQVQGVVLSTDIPETTSMEENNQAIYQTYTPDFNNEVRFEQKIKETESVIDELMKNQITIDEVNGQTQQILNENGYDIDAKVFNSIDEKQQQQTLLAHDFAKALGYDVDIVNDLGKNIHGSRSKETGRITIDASMGKNPVLQTLAHEITHGTESGSRYDELKRLVRSNFTDEQWEAEIKKVQDVYKRNAKQELAPEDAEKEIVAKYVEHNLNDEQFIEDLIRYNFSLASRIRQNMKSFFSLDENQNFKTTYERVFKTARDEMIDKTLQAIKDGFEGMVGENYVSKDNLQLSVAQYDVTGREILKRYLSDPENDISEESKNAILDRMEEVYKAMKEFEETGKYPQFSQWQDTFYSINDRGDLSVVINNGDYELNIDFSTVCKKRKMMDKVINALTKNGYLTKALKNTDIAKIREIIQNHKFEVACGLCFVDTKRFNQGSWAGRFETKWNKLIDQLAAVKDVDPDTFNFQAGITEATPGLADIDFSDPRLTSFVALSQGGSEESRMARALMNNPSLRSKVSTNDMYGSSGFEALQKANPELFRLVNASGGSSKPKLAHTEVTYFNEIINSPKFNPEEARKVGGVRLQSFSDFMTNMVFDYVQMFGDMEAKNLTGHSYTKVKEYALLFGKTGMKINLSLIPAGFDSDVYTAEDIAKMGKKSKEFLKLKENAGLKENGDYMFDKESFDFDLAVEIQNLDDYDKNVGTICVGVSDKHILKLLGDDRICMVIPYHRSGISPLVADKMGISTFNDYTNKQNTRMRTKKGTLRKVGIDFNFYEGSDVNGVHFAGMIENNYDAKKTADSYKAWCKANDYVPKFGDNPEILNHPNYYKLLIDFRAYDKNGNVAPQESVKISGDSGIGSEYVPLDTKTNPKLAELYGDNIGFNNVLEKGLDVYERNEERQNEAVDPIAQEVINELGLERKQFSVDSETDAEYMDAVGNGNMKMAQRLVDEVAKRAGYDIKAFHSTNAEFTKFSKEKQGTNFNNYLHFGSGFYFGPTVEETKRYGKNTMSVYLSADRLLDVGKPVENEKAYQYLIDNGYHPGDARYVMNYGDRFINALYDTLLDKYSQGGANVQVQNLLREFGYDGIDAVYGVNNDKGQVVVFEPTQIKSADPVTYDDNGNVIPLSERFNANNDDIRYSAEDDGDLTIDEKDLPISNVTPTTMKKVASESKTAKVLDKKPEGDNFKDLLKDGKLAAKRTLVDKYAAVDDLAQRSGNKKLIGLVDRAMRSGAIASRAIYNGVVDKNGKVIGKSLTQIMGKISPQDKQLFGEYMYHWRNVDEMSMVKRFGKDYKDKPVFGEDVTADDSMERIREIEKKHPEFKSIAEDMWELYRNLLGIRRDAGIISKETYDKFIKERPHYVRIIRDVKGGTGGTALNPNDIKKFKGSTENIIPIEDATMAHIASTYRVANNNELNSEILKTLGAVDESEVDDIETLVEDEYDSLIGNSKQKTLSAYRNGVKYSMEIGEELAKALTPTEKNVLMKIGDMTIAPLSQLRKKVITSINPIFTLFTNPTRDIQDAIRNTKYLKKYPRALAQAVNEIATNGELSQLYDNLGIRASSYIGQDLEKAFKKINTDNSFAKVWNRVKGIGENIEKVPRLAEFIASLEAGNSVDQAAYDAAEVTTNFKRGGTLVKTADKYGFTFLNASVQGFDKQIRNAKGDINKIKKNGVKGLISVLAQLTLASGLPLRMLLDWIWRDDDEYDNLSDYVKNNYYIIPNLFGMATGKGKKFGSRFLRIPKGRVAAFYQTVLDNIDKTIKKQTDIWDAMLDDLISFENNLAPNNFLDNNMFSPIVQAYRTPEGRTWYGEDLIPSRLQDIPDYEQFDEGTDSLSIAVGQLSKKVADALGNDKFQISPYKLNYLLDQYSGIFGDVLLPALSLETSVGVEDPLLKGVATAVLDKFTSDPVLKNQNVTSFYELKEAIDKTANGSEATDEEKLVSKYLGTVSSEMGKLYGEKRKIQLDDTLTNKEKLEKVRAIQTQINDLARNALGSYDQIDMIGDYASVGGVQYYKNEDGSWTKPTKKALEKLNNADLSMEDRNAYFKTYSEIDKVREEIKSRTPKGQDADYTKETIDAINNSGLSAKGKNTLYDSYYSSKFVDHVNSMDLTDEEKYNLKVANKTAEGTKDANGKTIANSKARAVAENYRKLGLLESVLKYIKDNDLAPSEMGLSKTVYNELIKGVNTSSSKGKKSSRSSKKTSKSEKKNNKTYANVGNGSTSVRGGGKLAKLSAGKTGVQNTREPVSNNFAKAYSSTFRKSGSSVSSGSGAYVTCPKCGNRVSSRMSRCPICGTNLS